MSIIENIQSSPDLGKYTGGVFRDLWKAFDVADHILQKKDKKNNMMSEEYQINGAGHTLKTVHNLHLLETIHLVLFQSP